MSIWSLLLNKKILFGSIIGTSFAGAVIIKDYLSGGTYRGRGNARDKICIVTGANTGMGKYVADALAQRGGIVVMACRNMEKCEETRRKIVLKTDNKYVYCRQCDLASFDSIKKFVKRFRQEHDQLDILVNNAGVMNCPKSFTRDGIEMQLGVNHMGHFLLTNLLLDYLQKPEKSRVVVVTSVSHIHGKINKEDLNSEKEYNGELAYNQSKLANCLFVNELSTKLLGTNVTVNAVHPGLVSTNITRYMEIHKSFSGYILHALAWFAMKTPDTGAAPIIHLAIDPEVEGLTGKYFSGKKLSKMSEEAQNVETARWLWAVSEKWTKLNEAKKEISQKEVNA